jgi:hypothetical protein
MSYQPARLHRLAPQKLKNSGSGLWRTGLLDSEPRGGPPGFGSISQRYGSGFFFIIKQNSKIVRKTSIPTVL